MARKLIKKEVKQKFTVLTGFVGLPDEEGEVKDIMPWERYTSGKNKGNPKRDDNGELIWEHTEIEAFPSKVSHIVASGKLILTKELAEFYPDLAEVAGLLDSEDDEDDDQAPND